MNTSTKESGSVLSRCLTEIRKRPHLTRDEEIALTDRVKKGDRSALNRLIQANLAFVVMIASKYRNLYRHLGLPIEDLLNEGSIGLIEAAHRFDADKGTRFISYAAWWIRKSMLKALFDHANLVHVPSNRVKEVQEIRDAESSLRRALGRAPEREEISDRLSKSVTRIEWVLQTTMREVSLEEKVGKDRNRPIAEFLVDYSCSSPEHDLINLESDVLVGEAVSHLTAQERMVVTHRFGLEGGPQLSLRELGKKMGISRERVRQIEVQAKARLRKLFAKQRRVKPDPSERGRGV